MPRQARKKSEDSTMHIVCRSITELNLYRDNDDKLKYLNLVKKYQCVYKFHVYAYCLMDTHVHLMIYVNGADISNIMRDINFSYSQYYNKRYKRKGHLFQERFYSKSIRTDKYLLTASAYIHNNVKDIPGYKDRIEKYEFSSLGIYLGIMRDRHELINEDYIMSYFGNSIKSCRKNYYELVLRTDSSAFEAEMKIDSKEIKQTYDHERGLLTRTFKSDRIIDFIAGKMEISKLQISVEKSDKIRAAKAMLVILLKGLCGLTNGDLCEILGIHSEIYVSQLINEGIKILYLDGRYRNLTNELIETYALEV